VAEAALEAARLGEGVGGEGGGLREVDPLVVARREDARLRSRRRRARAPLDLVEAGEHLEEGDVGDRAAPVQAAALVEVDRLAAEVLERAVGLDRHPEDVVAEDVREPERDAAPDAEAVIRIVARADARLAD